MSQELLRSLEEQQLKEDIGLKSDLDRLQVGDDVQVHFRIVEGERERIQLVRGTVMRIRKGGGANAAFTVRQLEAHDPENYLALDGYAEHRVSAITAGDCVVVSIDRDHLDLVLTWSQAADALGHPRHPSRFMSDFYLLTSEKLVKLGKQSAGGGLGGYRHRNLGHIRFRNSTAKS